MYASNTRVFSKRVTVFFREHRKGLEEECRMAFIAGKKVGGAVMRNRCKRLMREAVRLNRTSIYPGADYVFSAKAELCAASLSDVEKDLKYMFKKQGLWVSNG